MKNHSLFLRRSLQFVACSFVLFVNTLTWADTYAEDRAQIENLMARYLFAMDWRDADNYAATFTKNGILDYAGGQLQGHNDIAQMIRELRANEIKRDQEAGHMDYRPRTRHNITNKVIDINGNTAKAWSYWTALNNNGDDRSIGKVSSFGHYEDELIKVNGKWLFSKRIIFNEMLERRKSEDESPVPAR